MSSRARLYAIVGLACAGAAAIAIGVAWAGRAESPDAAPAPGGPREGAPPLALDALVEDADVAQRGVPVDPQAMLDQAVQNAEKAQQVTSQLLQAVAQPKPGEGGAAGEVTYSPEFQQQLAELDQQIAEQRERVERARQARDAAEAKQKK